MNTGPLSPIQAWVRKFEDIEPQGAEGLHASTLRDNNGKRYAVYADSGKVWPIYVYVFDEAQWYGIKHDAAMMPHVRSMLIHTCPVPTNMVRWQSPRGMKDIEEVGLPGAVARKIERAAKGDKS